MVTTILARIAAGEAAAFSELVTLYQRPLFAFLGRLGLSQAQAEDLAQETFLRAWSQLASYRPERGQFITWLFTIARNLAYDTLQKAAPILLDSSVLEALPAETHDPLQALDLKQRQAMLHAALRQLPLPDRSALALCYVHDLTLVEVAQIEAVSLAAIKTRLHRAKQRLRALLALDPESETHHEG